MSLSSIVQACQSVSVPAQENTNALTSRPWEGMCCGSQTGHLTVSGHLLPTHPSPPARKQSTVSTIRPTARPAYWLGQTRCEAAHTPLSPLKSPFECHILLLFNKSSVVCSLAEIQPALNHTWVFYPGLWVMSSRFQLQHMKECLFSCSLSSRIHLDGIQGE